MKAIAENAASYLLDIADWLRPSSFARRSNLALIAEFQAELKHLPMATSEAILAANAQRNKRIKEIERIGKLREAELNYRISQTLILLGDD